MKKIILLITLIVGVLFVGCSQQSEQLQVKEEKIESLKDAYFSVVPKIDNNEEVKVENIKKSLENYNYEQDTATCVYIFNNDNEDEYLLIYYKSNEEEVVSKITYSWKTELDQISLFYDGIDNENKFKMYIDSSDINSFEVVSKIVDDKGSKILKTYNKIAQNIPSEDNMSLDEIKASINIEPESEDYSDIILDKATRYTYKKDNETLTIIYTEGDKIFRATYSKNTDTGSVLFVKNIFNQKLWSEKNESRTLFNINSPVDSFSTQVKILENFPK